MALIGVSVLAIGMHRVSSNDPEFITNTKLGKIKGIGMTTRLGRKIIGFRRIPYAAPPIGPLRFKEIMNINYHLLIVAVPFICVGCDDLELIVSTKLGQVKGKLITTRLERKVVSFQGIPYAAPPVGPLRFKPPQNHPGYQGVLDATQNGNDCLQPDLFYNSYDGNVNVKRAVGSEDCLFLNVYTPNVKPEKLFPVMVFIHGGGFNYGTGSSILFGPELLMDKDIVLVTINYRLGIFGYLCTEDDVVPGNMGLKDQIQAFKWVQENIQMFGGDPKTVTIFGESAGSASVHFHVFSPHSKGLFHRAISQSGVATTWAIRRQGVPKVTSQKIATLLKCPSESQPFLDCLMSKSQFEILNATILLQDYISSMHFRPADNTKSNDAFVTPDLFKTKPKVPIIMGVNSAEGFLGQIVYNDFIAKKTDDEATEYLSKFLFLDTLTDNVAEVSKKLKSYYFGEKINPKNKTFYSSYINLVGDILFVLPALRACKLHNGPFYMYYLSQRPQRSLIALAGMMHKVKGASHTDDLPYLFRSMKIQPSHMRYNSKDKKLLEIMLDYWTHFATHGVPSGDGSTQTPWEPATDCSNIKYMELSQKPAMKQNLLKDRMDYLNSIL